MCTDISVHLVQCDDRTDTVPKCRVGHIALKSASPQAFFFVAPQCKLRFFKAQLCSLRFKILDVTFIRNFYDWIRYVEVVKICSHSVVVKSSIG
jgi:hypothetical protein